MKYTMVSPCDSCPFLKKHRRAYGLKKLKAFASGEFPCHKSAELTEDDDEGGSTFRAKEGSVHCAGALIFLERQDQPHQMMRICERLGLYDRTKLDMKAKV